MNQITRAWWLLILGMSFAAPAVAQTADEVIAKHIAALGGREVLGKLTSRKSTGTITFSTPNGDLSGPFESYDKRPNKSRAYMKLDASALGAGSIVLEQRFDGTNGWVLNSLQGDSEMTGNILENMRNNAFPTAMLTYKQSGTEAALQPRETLNGKQAIVLLITPTAGSPARLYLDPDTYLLMRAVSTVNAPQVGGNIEQTLDFSDYRSVDGTKLAFQTVNTNSLQTITIKISKVEHDLPIDDAMFGKK